MASYRFDAIGTKWEVLFEHGSAEELITRVHERIEAFDAHYSRFRADSLVSEMARKSGAYTMPEDFEHMFSLYSDLYKKTLGAFTPLIGQTLSDAGYDAQYSLVPKELQRQPRLEDILSYDHTTLTLNLKEPALLDFGAAGKGYLVDIVFDLLSKAGAEKITVDAGGDIRVSADVESKIGLENPQDSTKVIGVAQIQGKSICGSAGNRRAWGSYTHILDPHTLSSPNHIAALWVVADTTMLADALTTCLYFVPPATLLRDYHFSYFILRPDNSIEPSSDFPAEFFSR